MNNQIDKKIETDKKDIQASVTIRLPLEYAKRFKKIAVEKKLSQAELLQNWMNDTDDEKMVTLKPSITDTNDNMHVLLYKKNLLHKYDDKYNELTKKIVFKGKVIFRPPAYYVYEANSSRFVEKLMKEFGLDDRVELSQYNLLHVVNLYLVNNSDNKYLANECICLVKKAEPLSERLIEVSRAKYITSIEEFEKSFLTYIGYENLYAIELELATNVADDINELDKYF